jgi:glycosyltransferase involved in cell wall biosynthesis
VIVGYDATTLAGQLSGVGYYTSRLLASLANGAGTGVVDRLVVLSNRAVTVEDAPRLQQLSDGRFPLRSVWMQFVLPGLLRRLRPDVVHYTNYLAPVRWDAPYVVSIHDMSVALMPRFHTLKKRLLSSRLVPLVARGARLVLTPSESTRRDVVRLLGLDPGRVRVIPYAPAPAFRPAEPDPARLAELGVRAPYFLYVGTVEPRKNLARALRAFARVAAALPDHRFVIAGQRGWKYADVLREIARPELSSRVTLLGYVSEDDLPLLYAGATAFVYPSLFEGFGLPVVEAMACGTPVLTSRTSSLTEIADGAALLVDPLDEQALAEGLVRLAEDRDLRADLRARGLARASAFTWDRTGRETALAYREVVGEARRLVPASA